MRIAVVLALRSVLKIVPIALMGLSACSIGAAGELARLRSQDQAPRPADELVPSDISINPGHNTVSVRRRDESESFPNARRPYIKVAFEGAAAAELALRFQSSPGGRLVTPDRALDCTFSEKSIPTCVGWLTAVRVGPVLAENDADAKKTELPLAPNRSASSSATLWPFTPSYFYLNKEELAKSINERSVVATTTHAQRLDFGSSAVSLLLVADGTVDRKFGFLVDDAIQHFFKATSQASAVFDPSLAHFDGVPRDPSAPFLTKEIRTKAFTCGTVVPAAEPAGFEKVSGNDIYCSFPSATHVVIDAP